MLMIFTVTVIKSRKKSDPDTGDIGNILYFSKVNCLCSPPNSASICLMMSLHTYLKPNMVHFNSTVQHMSS